MLPAWLRAPWARSSSNSKHDKRQFLRELPQTVGKVLPTVCCCKSAKASLQQEEHHFPVRFAHGRKMIKEAACSLPRNSHSCTSSAPCDFRRSACLFPPLAATGFGPSRRTCRRCGFHMKGLRPLHTSPETTAYFVDDLRQFLRELSFVKKTKKTDCTR